MKLSRRDFLKFTGLASTATVALGHWPVFGARVAGPLLSFSEDGEYATVCNLCPLGCGLTLTVENGLIAELKANQEHPLNLIAVNCPLRQRFLLTQYPLNRLSAPLKRGPAGRLRSIRWDTAVDAITSAWRAYKPSEIAFLVGIFPDHVFDLVGQIASDLGGAYVIRYSAISELSSWVTMADASKKIFGMSQVPFFDVSNADLIFSFGDSPLENWCLDVNNSATRVSFSPYCLTDLSGADEWIAIQPGSEALVASAMASLVAKASGKDLVSAGETVDVVTAAQVAGLKVHELQRLAALFANSRRKVAIPGASVLGQGGGLVAGEAILALNAVAGSLGKEGGVYLKPEILAPPTRVQRPSTFAEVKSLTERIRSGRIKALFVHGVDPLSELPTHVGFEKALDSLELLISFAQVIDKTASQADYILPDKPTLESWGYQRLPPFSDRPGLSIWRPLVTPTNNCRATVDILLAAAIASGGGLAETTLFEDEADFVQKSSLGQVAPYGQPGDEAAGWNHSGGIWPWDALLMPPAIVGTAGQIDILPDVKNENKGECKLWLIPSGSYDHSGKIYIAISPITAQRFDFGNGQTALITSAYGQINAEIKLMDKILDGVAVMPLPQSVDPKPNAWCLFGELENSSGSLAYCRLPVKISV